MSEVRLWRKDDNLPCCSYFTLQHNSILLTIREVGEIILICPTMRAHSKPIFLAPLRSHFHVFFFHFHFSQQIALVHSSAASLTFPSAATYPWIVSGDNVNDTAKLTGEFISRQSKEKAQKHEIKATRKSQNNKNLWMLKIIGEYFWWNANDSVGNVSERPTSKKTKNAEKNLLMRFCISLRSTHRRTARAGTHEHPWLVSLLSTNKQIKIWEKFNLTWTYVGPSIAFISAFTPITLQ